VVSARTRLLTERTGQTALLRHAQLQDRLTLALGWVAVGNRDEAVVAAVADALFAQAPTRGVDLHLAVGEALACVGAGWACASLDEWRRGAAGVPPAADGGMALVLHRILTEFGPSPQPAVRQAVVLWILGLLRQAGRHPTVQVRPARAG